MPIFPLPKPEPACALAAFLLLGAVLHAAPENVPPPAAEVDTAWEEGSSFLFNEANARFHQLEGKTGVDERERRLGDGITLLNRQPRTKGNITDAQAIFTRLVQENGEDTAAIFARYFIGRIAQLYASPPDRDAARRTYRELVEKFPGDPLAEHAAANLVFTDLYENISPEERQKRFADLEALGATLKSLSGKREFHINLGMACLDLNISDERALEHFLLGEAEGITRWQTEVLVWGLIAELSRKQGQTQQAVDYYKKIIAKYPRDIRTYTMKQHLAALENAPAAAPSPIPAPGA